MRKGRAGGMAYKMKEGGGGAEAWRRAWGLQKVKQWGYVARIVTSRGH